MAWEKAEIRPSTPSLAPSEVDRVHGYFLQYTLIQHSMYWRAWPLMDAYGPACTQLYDLASRESG